MTAQEKEQLRIYIDNVTVVKPGLLRVMVYTVYLDTQISVDYEIVVQDTAFTTYSGDSAAIDLEKFKSLIVVEIEKLRNTGTIAAALMKDDLEWDVEITAAPEIKQGVLVDHTLAYGENE